MAKIIGLTGGIGSGKTSIMKHIETLGYKVYYADDAGKKVIDNIDSAIEEEYANGVYKHNGPWERDIIKNKLIENAANPYGKAYSETNKANQEIQEMKQYIMNNGFPEDLSKATHRMQYLINKYAPQYANPETAIEFNIKHDYTKEQLKNYAEFTYEQLNNLNGSPLKVDKEKVEQMRDDARIKSELLSHSGNREEAEAERFAYKKLDDALQHIDRYEQIVNQGGHKVDSFGDVLKVAWDYSAPGLIANLINGNGLTSYFKDLQALQIGTYDTLADKSFWTLGISDLTDALKLQDLSEALTLRRLDLKNWRNWVLRQPIRSCFW